MNHKPLLFTALLSLPVLAHAEPSRRFEDLTPENKTLVKETYKNLLNAREKKAFAEMQADAKTILALVSDYNDTKAYAAIAERGLQQTKEEMDPATQDRKKQKLRELAQLEIQGQGMVEKAKSNPETRAALYELMDKILALDSSNTYPAEWRKALHSLAGGESTR